MAAKLRPLSRAEPQKRKAPKVTGAEPSVKPGHSVRKFFVTAPTSKSISPQAGYCPTWAACERGSTARNSDRPRSRRPRHLATMAADAQPPEFEDV
jgi:hypothetical protein